MLNAESSSTTPPAAQQQHHHHHHQSPPPPPPQSQPQYQQSSHPQQRPHPRPRTSYASLSHIFTSLENNVLRPAASSIDLKRRTTVDIDRIAAVDSSLAHLDGENPVKCERRKSAFRDGLRRSFSMVRVNVRKNAHSRRGRTVERVRPELLPTLSASSSSSSTSNGSSAHPAQRLSPSPPRDESHSPRRHLLARDRLRRNAISFHPGQNTARSSQELLEISQLQAPQQFPISGGAGAKAAVAARLHEQKMQAQAMQGDFDGGRQELYGHLKDVEPMEIDSAFGDDTDEAVVMTDPPKSIIVRKDPASILPPEVCLLILEQLDMRSLTRVAGVSKTWNKMATANRTWQTAFLNEFGPRIKPAYVGFGGSGMGPNVANGDKDWKRMSKARSQIERNWQNSGGKAVYFQGHTDSVYCCQFDEEKIITGSRDRTIRVWDINTYKCLRVIGGPASKPTLPAADAALDTVRATVWPGTNVNGTPEGDTVFHTPSDYHSASILCLQYDDEVMVTGSSDASCLVWDMRTYEPIARLKHHSAGVLDVCLDQNWIVSCSKDNTICVWSRRTLQLVAVLRGHNGPVNAVQLRKNWLVSASGDGRCKLWRLDLLTEGTRDLNGICTRTFQSGDRGLAAVEFSDDCRYILAGGNDQIIYKFSVATGDVVDKYAGHTGLVRSLFLDYANRRVLSGSYDQGIRVYDFDDARTIGNYDNWTTSWILAAKSDYRRIVATSQDGRALMIDFGHRVEDAVLVSGNGRSSILE